MFQTFLFVFLEGVLDVQNKTRQDNE